MHTYSAPQEQSNSKANRVTIALFVVYIIALIWILLFKLGVHFSYMDGRSVNLIPFRQVILQQGRLDVPEVTMNIIIFIPLGVYTGILYRHWRFAAKLFFFFALSLLLEAVQYIFRIGAFDATDVVANTMGGISGLLLCMIIERIVRPRTRAQKCINIVALIGTVIMLLFLALLKLNMLPVRYQ